MPAPASPERLTPDVWVLPGPQQIGLVPTGDGRALIVDTGLSKDTGKAILRALDGLGLTPAAILTTHAHADHFGGNAHLVARTGVPVIAPAYEEATLRYPRLEPVGLFSGAAPIASLGGHFLVAPTSPVDQVIEPGRFTVAGVEVEAVDLGGHSARQTGYRIGGVLFTTDLTMPETVLDKYGIVYCHDVAAHLATMERLLDGTVTADWYVPAHSPPTHDLGPLLQANHARFSDTLAQIRAHLVAGPLDASAIQAALCAHYGIRLSSPEGYFLLQTTVYAHLSCLHGQGVIAFDATTGRWGLA